MKNFLKGNYKWLIFVLVLIIVVVVLSILFSPKFNAEIVGYRESEDYIQYLQPKGFYSTGSIYFNMTEETIKELLDFPERYSFYLIEIDIANISSSTIYFSRVSLTGKYDDLWLESVLFEYRMALDAQESTTAYAGIIVRTGDMSEAKINDLITSIGLRISSGNFKLLSTENSKTVYFNN